MFRSFFFSRQWLRWSILGTIAILATTYFQVQLDVRINEWYGDFYNTLQTMLTNPGSVTFPEFLKKCLTFAKVAAVYIVVAVLMAFFVSHYIFRWRTAMNDYYMEHWPRLRHIEGAAQRVQEDTMRFATIMESLGSSLVYSIMTLAAFFPLLITLSANVTELPWVGSVPYSLVWVAIISAASGTVLLAVVGIKLPGLEFNNQKVEAAYRKELVFGEDHGERAGPVTVKTLFNNVRKNYFRLYKHYLYFNVARYSYLQFSIVLPLIAMGPTIVAGAITLGVLQQVLNAFSKVESSFQFLVQSWSTIVELISIYKRLRAFESQIRLNSETGALS
ncbi:peptide antibiotic transporter SbmA [Candidatus Sororendozoicomonas aggregata]|uniref:peptide antibiotic transporter SbmA n=1 Tax=Candidatus Sororendozoicomonas aggregata TaxID=3073239 RepID=UPI002ED1C4CD